MVNEQYISVLNGKKIKDSEARELANRLPEVTENDNGKVLKVVDGAWALGEDESSGGGAIEFTSIGTATIRSGSFGVSAAQNSFAFEDGTYIFKITAAAIGSRTFLVDIKHSIGTSSTCMLQGMGQDLSTATFGFVWLDIVSQAVRVYTKDYEDVYDPEVEVDVSYAKIG